MLVERNYNETELKFRDIWVNQAAKSLGNKKKETITVLKEMFDKFFERGVLEIENTQTADIHMIPADKFFLKAKDKFILNESGTLTTKHGFRLGVLVPIIQRFINIRQIKKKAKVKAAEENDNVNYGILSNEEYTLKIVING